MKKLLKLVLDFINLVLFLVSRIFSKTETLTLSVTGINLNSIGNCIMLSKETWIKQPSFSVTFFSYLGHKYIVEYATILWVYSWGENKVPKIKILKAPKDMYALYNEAFHADACIAGLTYANKHQNDNIVNFLNTVQEEHPDWFIWMVLQQIIEIRHTYRKSPLKDGDKFVVIKEPKMLERGWINYLDPETTPKVGYTGVVTHEDTGKGLVVYIDQMKDAPLMELPGYCLRKIRS